MTQPPGAETVETARAVALVQTRGYVIFERALAPDLLERLREAFACELEAHVARTDPNRGANRYQMHLPFRAPFCEPQVVEHPQAMAVVEALLGPDALCCYLASDTPLPGSEYQPVHSDVPALFPGRELSLPPFALVVNIPLVDFTEENGPLEVWPGGTHRLPEGAPIAEMAPDLLSERVLMPAGSVLVRDIRMWHRGTPNRSSAPRPNLALIYARPWYRINYPAIPIAAAEYADLSERARRLFRREAIAQ